MKLKKNYLHEHHVNDCDSVLKKRSFYEFILHIVLNLKVKYQTKCFVVMGESLLDSLFYCIA